MNKHLKMRILTVITASVFSILFGLFGMKVEATTVNDPYEDLKKISTSQIFEQGKNEYYLYFYYINCSYCNLIREEIIDFASERDDVFLIDYAQASNKVNSYDWNALRSEYNKRIGYLDENEEIVYLMGESAEKYENQVNKYGKLITYSFMNIDNDVYAIIQTPEIDYASVEHTSDLIIAGVPTLLHVSDGVIDGFYFDVFEISVHLLELAK